MLPPVIIDSGHQWYKTVEPGTISGLKSIYKGKIEAELNRPPQAEVEAVMQRVNNALQFKTTIKNLSGGNLSNILNNATVHAIIYIEVIAKYPIGPSLTSHYVISKVALPISSTLPNGSSATFTLNSPDLVGVDWNNVHGLVLVDYRPGGQVGPYDMLQAALAITPAFSIEPSELVIMIDPNHPTDPTVNLSISGNPPSINWSSEESLDWLSINPTSGTVGSSVEIRVDVNKLDRLQTGSIRFTETSPLVSYEPVDIPVTVIYDKLYPSYFPVISK